MKRSFTTEMIDSLTSGPTYDPVVIGEGADAIKIEACRDEHIWSSALVVSDQNKKFELFSYGIGESVGGGNTDNVKATELHTNIEYKGGSLPTNQAFRIQRMSLEFLSGITLTAFKQLIDYTYLQFFIAGQTPLLQLKGRHIPGGTGPNVTGTANATGPFYQTGRPAADNYYYLGKPLSVRPGTEFKVTVENIKDSALALGAINDELMTLTLRVWRVTGIVG